MMFLGPHESKVRSVPDRDDGKVVFSGEEGDKKFEVRKYKDLYFAVVPNTNGLLAVTVCKTTFHRAEDLARIVTRLPHPIGSP